MKKLLMLLGALSVGTVAVTPLVACSSPQGDGILNTLNNGNGNYDLWSTPLAKLNITKPAGAPPANANPPQAQTLTKDQLQTTFAQDLAKAILTDAESKDQPVWYSDSLAVGTKCYDWKIDNGTVNDDGSRTWDVFNETGRFDLKIIYAVGTVGEDKKFTSEQSITKTFGLRCAYTQTDYQVYQVVSAILVLPEQKIAVNVTNDTKPKVGAVASDFSDKTKQAVSKGIHQALPNANQIGFVIKGIKDEKVTDKLTLQVNLVVSLGESSIDMSVKSPYDDSTFPPTILAFTITK